MPASTGQGSEPSVSVRIAVKNGNVIVADLAGSSSSRVNFLGREILVQDGVASSSGSGLLLPADRIVTSETSHEVVVLASSPEASDLAPGDRVIIYLGGDDGSVSANGISAFVKVDGIERGVIPARFIWAKIRDGEVIPRGRTILTEADPAVFRKHVLGSGSALHHPDALLTHGFRATGGEGDGNMLGAVNATYERIVRTGHRVTPEDAKRGDVACFSPSYMATRLVRNIGLETHEYHLVDVDEVYFVEED
jgi:hypothetical protein